MWAPGTGISNELQLLKLRHSDLQRAFDRSKPRFAGLVRRFRNTFEKTLPKGIVLDNPALNDVSVSQ